VPLRVEPVAILRLLLPDMPRGPMTHSRQQRATRMLPELVRPEWMKRAACRGDDVNMWFPVNGPQKALKFKCQACPVRHECLEYALEHRIMYGTWGGVSERKRVEMLKSRPIERKR
jgi:WhiB family transcriptional regulator, redox-sensing transcriptional regulator